MACRGVFFSLSDDEVRQLRELPEDDRVEHVTDVIEEEYFAKYPERLAETDKAWDAMHRVLADGELTWDGGEYPLNHVVLGGELLYEEDDYVLSLKSPQVVQDACAPLAVMTREEFRRRYEAIDGDEYQDKSDEDFEYTWEWFQTVREFWQKAASEGRSVLFSVDQ